MSNIDIAATFRGLSVPNSPYMNEVRAKRINAGRYEGPELNGVLKVVEPSDRVMELGAGLGVVGGACALLAKPERMISFEANPNLLPHIQTLYAINDLSDRIEVRNQLVVSSPVKPESMTFYLHASFLGSSLQKPSNRRSEPVEVPTVSFDDVRNELNPTILIIDIEGGELEFLEHADLTGVRAIIIEFHPGVYSREGMLRCKSILTDAGFVKCDDVSTRATWTCTRRI